MNQPFCDVIESIFRVEVIVIYQSCQRILSSLQSWEVYDVGVAAICRLLGSCLTKRELTKQLLTDPEKLLLILLRKLGTQESPPYYKSMESYLPNP
jgi:hypothetical protein